MSDVDAGLARALEEIRERVEERVQAMKREQARQKWLENHPWLKRIMFWERS